jgi:CheY-like chemotaxis protein
LGETVRIETVLAAGLWRVYTDANQLESALVNLAVNARDAMPEGGRLTIATTNAEVDDDGAVGRAGAPRGEYVLITVADTGCGMSPDTAARAFDPFFTTKPVGKGTGLGLSQVHGFVHQSRGHVKIDSTPDVGTTVRIYLPRSVHSGAASAEGVDSRMLPRAKRDIVVLVVEDEEQVRQVTVEALRELNYRVLEASGARKALELLDANPDVDLLFTDIVMPEVNGRKLADEALRRSPNLKVLYTTGYTRDAIVHDGVLDPGVNLLGKPFNLEQLARKLAALLDR